MLPAEATPRSRQRTRAAGVAAQDFEQGSPVERMGDRRGMGQFVGAPLRLIDQLPRAFDLAELPSA